MEEFSRHLNISLDQDEITLCDAISLDSFISNHSLPDIPSYMLGRIMHLDIFSRNMSNLTANKTHKPASVFDNPLSTFFDEDEDDDNGLVHPMDVFLYLFLKSHPIFRQTLVNQIFKCQLSLPLITYDSFSNHVNFNHFAFQTLILSRYIDKENTKTFAATGEPLPIVSFMRVSDCENSQKSEFLNRILKIKECFFTKECKGSTKKRFFLNGTVEIAWSLARYEKNNIINQHYILLNLRGDAFKFPKQRSFLGEISSIVYIFIPLSELTHDIAKQLEEMHDTFKAKIILLIYKGNPLKSSPEGIQNIFSAKYKIIALKKKNVIQNLELIEKSISQCLDENERAPQTLTECIKIATQNGILCDCLREDISSTQNIVESMCKDFQQLSDHVENVTSSKRTLRELKQELLPLQEKFGDWAEANRKRHRNLSEIEEYNCNIEKAQMNARQIQIGLLSKPSILISVILKQCPLLTENKNRFFLFWDLLKNYFNDVSREHLPVLYSQFKKWLMESYAVHSNIRDVNERNALQNEAKCKLLETAECITQSSFGIEHIFREIGQIYEAYLSIRDVKDKLFLINQLYYNPKLLPSIMANLILHGHSFEIVNGDVNHVPLQWVSDVLSSLSELIGADKKIFVISILGIQSSGKSTLLNTMFGINFPVSSGRCTRGVFMQMIEVKQSLREEMGYEYLVLLDTEGLRAPEISGSLSYKRDNEMATFTVGLGDVAVINIKGESHSEVQDILEITVIAFIRMKLTHGKPKCFFVHQNVGDIEAKTNLMIARKTLIDTLNQMTSCAAKQEKKEFQFNQFCDVIEFDPEEDVFYFPGLFEGEPPMTSISQGYIKHVEKLRSRLISCCSSKNRTFLDLKQWKKKLSCLWNSVLKENFVFSYRNILELNCRVELDISLSSWRSNFTQEMAVIKSEYFNQLSNVENCQIQNELEAILNDIFEHTQKLFSDAEQSMMNFYFIHHERSECFQQWYAQTKRYFKSCREREYRKVKEECYTISRVKETNQIIEENFANCCKEIVAKVRKLYELNKDKDSFGREDSVQINFHEIWNEWKSQIQILKIDCADISRDLQQVLLEVPILQQLDVISEKKFLIEDVTKYNVFGRCEFQDIIQIYGESQLDYNYYEIIDLLKPKTTLGNKVKKFSSSLINLSNDERTKTSECLRMRSIIENLDSQIHMIVERFPSNSNYCIDFFHVLIDESIKAISDHNETEKSSAHKSLILTNHFIFDFVFYQCCKAIKKFEIFQESFLEQNSIELKLCQFERTLKDNFSQLCAGIHSEDLCARLLTKITLDGMRRYLQDTVLQLLHQLFINDVENGAIYTSRASLQLAILKELVRKKRFRFYIRYIEFPFDYIIRFIQKHLLEYSQRTTVLDSIMNNLDTKIKHLIAKFIEAAQINPVKEISSWEEWKQKYHRSISNYVREVKLSDLGILDVHYVANYKQFSNLFKLAMENSYNEFDWKEWVQGILTKCEFNDLQETIITTLIECKALCPFCREPCQLTAGEHDHYCGSFHRPQGISGRRYLNSDVIFLEECTQCVLTNARFLYKNNVYSYSNYRTVDNIFKSWNILGQDSIESKYWQWVLCTFQKEFVDYYGIVPNEQINQKWSHLTEEEVIADIELHYKNYIFQSTK